MTTRARFEISGLVQGVGFRPFVHRLATELGLDGVVGNDAAHVFIEVLGAEDVIVELARRVEAEAPPLAAVQAVRPTSPQVDIVLGQGFTIAASRPGDPSAGRTFVAPDTGVCADCLREMFDPYDRRFGHPFITCTNCGPRFTITRALPYDRAATTMAGFEMCSACRKEYEDRADRRFHAQPIGCHGCGPTLRWMAADGAALPGVPIEATRSRLVDGAIVAVKGIGGFHLVTDGTSDDAVAELRARKHRADKPFAVMVADLEQANSIADITAAEADLLSSPARPIVLCRAAGDSPISELVAPGNPLIGIMLPYTPVHHLLFGPVDEGQRLGPLVMTSGNLGGEPICYRDVDVVDRLGHLVDAVLTHDRPIHVPCDDSVVRMTKRGLLPIRRARGYAPMPITLADAGHAADGRRRPSILAVGGELKNAFCVTNGTHAWVSQHIGDMENLETLNAFTASVHQFCDLYDVTPEVVVADTHPAYRSSGWARTNHGDRVVEVQHHHAHVVAVMAEHGLDPSRPALGVAFDGTGDGTDGTIWGGELLLATAATAERVGHLRPTPLPGGDAAIRHPWRVALSFLRTAGIPWDPVLPPVAEAEDHEVELLAQQLDRDLGCVPTSSMGRFFDALASLVGLRHAISYEAQAAIEFEFLATSWEGPTSTYLFDLTNPTPLLRAVCDDVRAGMPTAAIAMACHAAIADGVVAEVIRYCAEHSIDIVALTGGVFQNVLLTDLMAERLEAVGLDVRTHRLVPPNDGGLALGQAMIAHHSDFRTVARRTTARPAPDSSRFDTVDQTGT